MPHACTTACAKQFNYVPSTEKKYIDKKRKKKRYDNQHEEHGNEKREKEKVVKKIAHKDQPTY